jgi:acyl-CoA synthetase (AMP-forming)/AMP-acid ligase II
VKVDVAIEATDKKSFATAVDWPGWSRSGKTEELAVEALLAYADRYAPIAKAAGETLSPGELEVDVVEHVAGGGATSFGVPEKVTDHDRRRVTAAEAKRLAAVVEAAWATFDRISKDAPEQLRKGPRGGGRDTSKIVDHVFGAEQAYASVMGIKRKEFPTSDREQLDDLRAEMLAIIGAPSDGEVLAGKRWTTRYAAHRIAWHALDHAWEIEDRSEPAG